MTLIFKLVVVVSFLMIIYLIWQVNELMRFNRTCYQICSDKLKSGHKWVVLSDLHLWCYGKHNEQLIQAIREEAPEAIVEEIVGDPAEVEVSEPAEAEVSEEPATEENKD